MANNYTKFILEQKKSGDPLRSADWNAAMQEIVRLETAKINREGAESLQGPLTIAEALTVSAISPPTSTPLEIKGALKLAEGVAINQFSADESLSENSDSIVPTQKAVKTYVDAAVQGSETKDFQAKIFGGVGSGLTAVPIGCLAIVWRAKASMHFTIRVEWQRKDGTTPTAEFVTSDHGACESGGDVGLKLAEAKRIVAWLQEIVVKEQLEQYCEAARECSVCGQRRPLKDNRQRRFYTVFGKITVKAPRFHGCRCQD